MSTRNYGWAPQLPDKRDLKYTVAKTPVLPTKIDLRAMCPPVYDQGQLGSCVANATAGAFEYEQKRQGIQSWTPSRLFIYYNGRVIEGTVPYDYGLYVRDGIKTVVKSGVCNEIEWPYTISQFAVQPTTQCYTDAKKNEATQYLSLNNSVITTLKTCLLEGYPFILGFTVYSSFESEHVATTGIMPMPNFKTEQVLGGHCVMCVGYDDSKSAFIMRNSWGTSWGLGGYFYMPYAYATDLDLASDFWTIRVVQ